MEQSRLTGLLAVVCTTVIWGLSFISVKITVAVIPPMTLAFLRFFIAFIILFLVFRKMEPDTRLAMTDMPLMILSGVLGVTAFYGFQNYGIKLTTASAASMIVAAIPILTIIGEVLIFKTRIPLIKTAAILLSIGGVYLIVASFPQEGSQESRLGNLFMMGAAVSWVVYTLVTKPLTSRYSQLAVVTYQIFFGTLALIPFTFFESFPWQAIHLPIILHLIYLGLFCSALANYCYVYAMGILGVSNVSLFINLIPVISVIGGIIILHETVSGLQILGGTFILFAVYVANFKKGKGHEKMVEI